MVTSILDTDLYKLSQQLAVCKLFPRDEVRYQFFNRGHHKFPVGFGLALRAEIEKFNSIHLSEDECLFLRDRVYFFDPVYFDFLSGYRFNPNEVFIEQQGEDLKITITGPWYRTILWEVPLMATISELYYSMTGRRMPNRYESPEAHVAQENINTIKLTGFRNLRVKIAEFGTRRRFSYDVQNELLNAMNDYRDVFVGTSNVHFAMVYGWTPIGTQAHEWFQFHAAKYGYRMANQIAMENWVRVYNGNLGIVLPDTFTTDVFLRTFDTKYAKLFDGGRQDSGDPIAWTNKWTEHYRKLRIDPSTKSYIYSDGIKSLDTVATIHQHYVNTVCNGHYDRARDSFGIGTWLTNDVGPAPLNIVIKMTAVKMNGEWVQTVKLSDHEGKNTGDPRTIQLCKEILGLESKFFTLTYSIE